MAAPPALIGAGLVGFALGGFFDGIVLHQLLQWHHVISLVSDPALRTQRVQLSADGLLHVLMYGVALAGLRILWRHRGALPALPGAQVAGAALVGFAAWHGLDAVLNHWLLGLHHIRDAAANPVAWDIGWLAVFGGGTLAIALKLLGRAGPGGPRVVAGLAALAVAGGGAAALPPPGTDTAVVVFAPGTPAQAVRAAAAAGTPMVWLDPSGLMMAVRLDAPDAAAGLRAAGALLVVRSPALAGCLAAAR